MQLIKVAFNFPIKLSVITPFNYSKVIILPKANISEGKFFYQRLMGNTPDISSNPIIESPQERRERFLLEFEKPFKCEKCNERFKKKKYLREHKTEAHSY